MSRSVQTPSKAFAFPNEWLPVRLGSIGKTYGGLTGKSGEDFNTGSASYVTFMQVMGNSRLREPAKGTVNIKPGERQNRVQKDDLLFNGSSETPEEVALAAAVDFHPDSDTFLNSFCFGFRLLPDAPADSLYLAYLFRSSVGRNLVSSLAQGATRYNISKTQLLNQAIHLPSKAEQIAIREKLTDAEELIKSLERLISKKQAVKQGMMQELLTGRTRLPGFKQAWSRATLGRISKVTMGQSPVGSSYNTKGNGLPLIQGNADVSKRATIERVWTSSPTKISEPGNVILTVRAPVGHAAIASHRICLGRGVCGLDAGKDNSFLFHLLVSNESRWSLFSQGSTFTAVGSNEVDSFTIDWPCDPEERSAIAKVLADADQEIDALQRHLESVSSIKQGMMQELLTGRVRLPVGGQAR